MAAAYFLGHVAPRGSLWWWRNGGELPILYCFVWLYFAAAGAGRFSVDAWWAARRR
jgi:putative oxidoreductase